MGSTTFHDIYTSKTATLQEAYLELVAQALADHGHDPYSGTIATTDGVQAAAGYTQRLHTLPEAHRIADERIDNLHKWEACEGLRLMDLTDVPRRTVRKAITLRTSVSNFKNWRDEIEAAARAAVPLRAGEDLEHVTLVHENFREQVTRKYQVSVDTVKEKSETRYFITDGAQGARDWSKGHTTQAEARAALIDMLNTMDDSRFNAASTTYGIVGETRRASGAPLVKATRRVVSLTAVVDVTMYKRPTVTKQGGWLLYGWAAC